MVPAARLCCLVLSLTAATGAALAQQSMALPPQEDPELWKQAWLEVAQDGKAPNAMPHLAVGDESAGWSLTVWDVAGEARTVGIQQPRNHADRVDLLFLALSLAKPRDDWGWSAITGAPEPPLPPDATAPPPDAAPAQPSATPESAARPTRSFVSATTGAARTTTPPQPEPEAPRPTPTEPAPSVEPVPPPTPGTDEEPEPLDPLFPEPRPPIPILDDPDAEHWPTWAWVQLGAGPTWRPETALAWEGSLHGGWTGHRLRLGLGLRLSTPTTLTAFHAAGERRTRDLDLLAGPWIPLGRVVDVGLEGGLAVRWYEHQGQTFDRDYVPMAAVELATRWYAGQLRLGPYLRGCVDLDSTQLGNGSADPQPENLQLWSLSLGIQLAGVGSGLRSSEGE